MNELDRNRVFLAEEIFLGDQLRVLRSSGVYEYVDNVKTDKRIATYLDVVDLSSFDKYRIKVPLSVRDLSVRDVRVQDLVNFKATLYIRHNKIYWSMTADDV